MTMFHIVKRLALVAGAVFALVLVVSCGQPVATVAPTPAVIVEPVATEIPQAIQELAAPEAPAEVSAPPEVAPAPPVVDAPVAASNESAPCAAGQLKGNDTSHIFHAPGQLAYARTHANVTCFDTAAEATAAGYRAAKR